MRYDGFDVFKIGIRTGGRIGQNARAVEYIQSLIFHRAHIEIIDRNDVEKIKVIFAPIDLFIPAHRGNERLHGKTAFILITRADPDVQRHITAGCSGKLPGVIDQITGHKCKKIGRFRPGIMPFCPAVARCYRIAVGQQHRQASAAVFDANMKAAHHIRAIRVIGDFAKPFGFALGAIHAV